MKRISAIGLMSGSSLDGLDGVWIDATPEGNGYKVRVRGHLFRSFPRGWKEFVRAIATHDELRNGYRFAASWSEFSAQLVRDLIRKSKQGSHHVDVIGAHGQTVVHLPTPKKLFGYPIGITIQLADLSRLSVRTGIPVVGNFRTADIAVGGEGAPLAPAAHRLLFGKKGETLAIQNMGGIGNVTLLRNGSVLLAFDTGPGNTWIDQVVRWRIGKAFDRSGELARRGSPNLAIAKKLFSHPYFRRSPPKSAGWENFGSQFLNRFRSSLQKLSVADSVATVTYATVEATARAYEQFIFPAARLKKVVVVGGGAKNLFLMRSLTERLPWLEVTTSEAYGLPVDQIEGIAFALLAIETMRGRTINEPKATGARAPVLCGQIAPIGQGVWARLG